MRHKTKDKTLDRNYKNKWNNLIQEYEVIEFIRLNPCYASLASSRLIRDHIDYK